jgi:pimeloyl-ACP methyl ester carboxylesterase
MTQALDHFRTAPVEELTISGRPLRYRVFGDGPAVVFVHGWPLSGVFMIGERAAQLGPQLNALKLAFDPNGIRPVIEDWQATARSLLLRLHTADLCRRLAET